MNSGKGVAAVKNDNPQLSYSLGLNLHKLGKLDEALLEYKKATRLKPDYVEAHIRIGDILIAQDKVGEVELRYKRIITLKPDFADAYYNLGMAQQKLGKLEEAISSYQKAIALKSRYAVTALNNLGAVFNELGKADEAGEMFRQAVELNPDIPLSRYNLATYYKSKEKFEEAVQQYIKVLALKPGMVEAQANMRHILRTPGTIPLSFVTDKYEQDPSPALQLALVHVIHQACAWDKLGNHEAELLKMVRENGVGVASFEMLRVAETANDLLLCARQYNSQYQLSAKDLFIHTPRKTKGPIKIGYLSCDLQEHATSYLMAELFERHDHARFHLTAYSWGPEYNDDMRKRHLKSFDDFVDLEKLSDAEAATKIYADGIDILIDLKGGTTDGARIGIPAYRPAPIQVNYLGYPGTMGVDFIDYIIADRFIIPEDQERFYSEKVVCLPDSYQPNDTHRKISETVPSRKDCGLPEQGFVFCSFNNTYKITPQIFDIWMRLLQKVPGSVLWLLEANRLVKENLRQEATRHDIDPARIIFAPRASLPNHLARHQHADLFLDTLPVNAHTTTSDALWAGLPVLTCAGNIFAGRVAGSLLKAVNLPEMITYSLEEYEAKALELAQNPERLAAMRKRLVDTRLQVPLFDIEKFTRNLEKSYQMMYDIWQAGEPPRAFTVS